MAIPTTAAFDAAASFLDVIVDGYAAEPADLPEHRLVTPGQPAWDCEGLYVQVERLFSFEGEIAAEQIQPKPARAGHAMRAAAIGITIIRCVPAGSSATPDNEQATAELVLADAVRVWNLLLAAERAGDLRSCSDLAHQQWEAQGPGGALVGGLTRVYVRLGRP